MQKVILIFLFLFVTSKVIGQDKQGLVQFSGVVVTADSLVPVPYVNILIKNTNRGTVSDYFGFFSFVAHENDTIEFSAIGFKRAHFVIPDSLNDKRYSQIQMLSRDTILLQEAVIYPWPTKEQFKEAFLNLKPPDDDLDRARKNLARAELLERAEQMAMDGPMNQKYMMQQESSRLYYAGQLPVNNLLNPLAWAAFVKAWKNGDFKRKEKE